MTLLLIGLAILLVGGWAYGKYCERVFGPDDRQTPAYAKRDGVDYVPMKGWKNTLINLLNIAGTGPVLGPIQGILFGPIALITIPLGCVLAGAMHDYFNGMIATRNGGAQMPKIVSKYLGKQTKAVYLVFSSILLMLVGVVFVYTPGDLIVGDILRQPTAVTNWVVWLVYGLIFLYYIAATIFPIDKLIGRVYPVFGGLLALSAVGILISIFIDGGQSLHNINGIILSTRDGVTTASNFAGGFLGHFQKIPFIPVFFIVVACGIMSGFHGSQTALVSRTIEKEKQGRWIFFNSMLMEGVIAMAWAAGAMILFNRATLDATGTALSAGAALNAGATGMVGNISRTFLGSVGGIFAVIGVIVLPITSGDTAFRALRLQTAERFKIDQRSPGKRMGLAALIFVPAIAILVFAKTDTNGFTILWRYFGWANQTLAVFALGMTTVYLAVHKKFFWIAYIPAIFYCFVVFSFIFHANIGVNLDTLLGLTRDNPNNYTASYALAAVVAALYAWFLWARMHNTKEDLTTYEA
ncbi:MAG TPA: carbon starvation CstA family protein [Candidatus Limnocylindria bacterium]|nr:carbon starvation CstA family protein [Candidatus Limnocylindria bacterium]